VALGPKRLTLTYPSDNTRASRTDYAYLRGIPGFGIPPRQNEDADRSSRWAGSSTSPMSAEATRGKSGGVEKGAATCAHSLTTTDRDEWRSRLPAAVTRARFT